MRVGSSADRHVVIVSCLNEEFVDDPDVISIHRLGTAKLLGVLSGDKHVVAQRLDLNIVIQAQDLPELFRLTECLSCKSSVFIAFHIRL